MSINIAKVQKVLRMLFSWVNSEAGFAISKHSVYGHNYFNPGKSCPGRKFDMDLLRGMLP